MKNCKDRYGDRGENSISALFIPPFTLNQVLTHMHILILLITIQCH